MKGFTFTYIELERKLTPVVFGDEAEHAHRRGAEEEGKDQFVAREERAAGELVQLL